MRHEVVAEGYGIRLRGVQAADAEFIVRLRNEARAHGNIGATPTDVEAQARWIEAQIARPDDHYFIGETIQGEPLGTFGLYPHDRGGVESGRFVVRTGIAAGDCPSFS